MAGHGFGLTHPLSAVFQLLKLCSGPITPVVSMGIGVCVILSCKIAQVTFLDRTAESCLLRDL